MNYTIEQYTHNFSNLLGVDMSDKILNDDIFKFLSTIEYIEDFRKFVIQELSERKYLSDYEFKNATLKLYILFKKYTEIKFKESNNPEKIRDFSEVLFNKIRFLYFVILKIEILELDKYLDKDKKPFFTQNEQKAIVKLGGLLRVARLSENREFFFYTLAKANKKALKQIPNQNKVLKLASKALSGVA